MTVKGEKINAAFQNASEKPTAKRLRLMTHLVMGYPSFEMNLESAAVMQRSGVDLLELQFPFSDPMADGPTIAHANQAALDQGITPSACFSFIKTLRKTIHLPLVAMTYYNLPFRYGIKKFFQKAERTGLDGLLIPDLPFDCEREGYFKLTEESSLAKVQVVSPGMTAARLKKSCARAESLIYSTLKVGVTGAKKELSKAGLQFLRQLRNATSIPIVAGFGISNAEQVRLLRKTQLSDAVVIGSRLLELLRPTTGLKSKATPLARLEQFLAECRAAAG